jgi:DNA-binding NarL/FixJ family response regulator
MDEEALVLPPRASRPLALLVDDHSLVVAQLSTLLRQIDSRLSIDAAASLEEALRKIRSDAPDYILLDLKLGDAQGLEALEAVTVAAPSALVAVVSGDAPPARMRAAYKIHGASAFIPKRLGPDELCKALEAFVRHGFWFPIEAMAPDDADTVRYSKREIDILRLLDRGDSNKRIAHALGLSPDTVKWHLSSLYEKTGTSGRVGLLARARADGIVG